MPSETYLLFSSYFLPDCLKATQRLTLEVLAQENYLREEVSSSTSFMFVFSTVRNYYQGPSSNEVTLGVSFNML